jgi:hypothetical protein
VIRLQRNGMARWNGVSPAASCVTASSQSRPSSIILITLAPVGHPHWPIRVDRFMKALDNLSTDAAQWLVRAGIRYVTVS